MKKKIISLCILTAAVTSLYGCEVSIDFSKANNIKVASDYQENEVKEDENDNEELERFHIENPSWDYYNADNNDETLTEPLELEQEYEKENNITDDKEWFDNNELANPVEELSYSQRFTIDKKNRLLLTLNDKNMQLDFSDYKYADYYKEENKKFIAQEIQYAKIKDDILYVSIGHMTYAESCPHNAYIVAVDLNTKKVIWKTEPLTCNSRNFIIVDDVIICGYGFTEEDDYLKQIDIKNGKTIHEIPLKTAADFIILKGQDLYVRCYDTDYKYNVKTELK